MGTLRFSDLQNRLTEVLDFTSPTLEDFHLKAKIRDTVIETCSRVHLFRLQYRPRRYAF